MIYHSTFVTFEMISLYFRLPVCVLCSDNLKCKKMMIFLQQLEVTLESSANGQLKEAMKGKLQSS